MFKRIVPLVVALALLVPCLLVPASALPLDYNDFVTDVKVDGDNDICTVVLPLDYSKIYVTDTVNSKESVSSYGTGSLHTYLDPSDEEHAVYFFSISNEDDRMDVTQIPDGSVVDFNYRVWFGFPCAYIKPDMTIYIEYFDYSGNLIGEQHQFFNDIDVSDVADISASLTIAKPTGAVTMRCFAYLFHIYFDENLPYYECEFSMKPTVITMSISSLHRLQQSSGETNVILNSVEKQLEKNGQKLEQIINMPVKPVQPNGSGVVSDVGNKEDQLLQSGAVGRDEFNNMLGSAAGSLENYIGSFAFLSACMNPIIDIPWIKEILTISLGLGLTGFILNLGLSAISKAAKDKSSGKGGKNKFSKGGG